MSSPTLPHPHLSQQSVSVVGTHEPSDTQEKNETADNNDIEDIQNELDEKKIRKKVSKVWEYFEEVDILENKVVVKKIKCKYCSKKYAKPKSGTTSQLKRHINECFYLKNQPKGQGVINFTPSEALDNEIEFSPIYSGSTASYDIFKIREIMAKMIIVHEYPFTMVEHTWFNILCKALNHNFQKVTRNTIKNECLKVYETEKEKLKKVLKNVDKISLTCDCWTSKQTIGYMALTAHFIDSEWQLQKRIINFIELEPPHTGLVISDAISDCLLDWGIQDKVSTITLDNASSNDVAARSLILNFERRNKLHFKGMFFHIRCCAHVLNLMVQDSLKEITEIIYDIRESVKYFKKSPGRLQKFGEIAKQLGLSTERGLSSDIPTRWNSTYKMLDAAFHYKLVFGEYANRDPCYRWCPSEDQWERYEKIRKFLEAFYNVSNIFSATDYPTSNKFLRETYRVKKVLVEQATSDDYFLRKMAEIMVEKFDKYWGSCNLLMAIASILDPRYKMLLIKFCFSKIYPSHEVERNIMIVQQALSDLYDSYASEHFSSFSEINMSGEATHSTTASSADINPSSAKRQRANDDDNFDDFVRSSSFAQPEKSDLEIYLEEGCALIDHNDSSKFDVLGWWKMNNIKFRVLSKLARDVLSIPITTVASESAFSAGGRVLDDYRSQLAPKTVDALVCAGNWIRASRKSTKSKFQEITEMENLHVSICENST